MSPRVKRAKPEAAGRRKFHDGERVRAMEAGIVFDPVEGETYWSTGDEFDSSHPAVVASPMSFLPADIPTNEIGGWLPEIEYPEPERDPRIRISEPTPIPDARKVIALEFVGSFARSISKGQIVDAKDAFVQQRPECFSVYQVLTPEDAERLAAL